MMSFRSAVKKVFGRTCPYLMKDQRLRGLRSDIRRCEAGTKLGNPMADPRMVMGFDRGICEDRRHRNCPMFRTAEAQPFWAMEP